MNSVISKMETTQKGRMMDFKLAADVLRRIVPLNLTKPDRDEENSAIALAVAVLTAQLGDPKIEGGDAHESEAEAQAAAQTDFDKRARECFA